MSASQYTTLDLEEQVVCIRRMIVESDKFAAEQRKLSEEAAKIGRDRWLAPVLAITSMIVATGSAVIAIATLLRH